MTGDGEIEIRESELERRLELADGQLALYARDLRRVLESERRKARELAEANERLAILSRLKSDFLAFISHELRTPLSAMSVLNLMEEAADPEESPILEIVRRGYERLQELIGRGLEYFDWLATERISTAARTDVARVFTKVANLLPGLIEERLQIACPSPPPLVRAEEEHVRRIASVLLDNAAKFSREEERIRIEVTRAGRSVGCSVSDRGVGLSPSMLREVFRPFTVADISHHSRGTGLSLALAKAIVERYGGAIRADSRGEGEGTTVSFDLPAVEDPAEASEVGK